MLNSVRQTNEIFVVDDDTSVRDALSMALRSEGYAVESFANAASILKIVRMRAPAAILLDVMLPDNSGLEVLKALKAEHYPVPILMMTGHGDIPMAVEAIKLGAYDFVEKPFTIDVLVDQLKGAMDAQARREQNASGLGEIDLSHIAGAVLTPREREVLREIATGASSKEAGRILGISPRTVEVHRARIMDKLGARNAADLMRIIFSHNG